MDETDRNFECTRQNFVQRRKYPEIYTANTGTQKSL